MQKVHVDLSGKGIGFYHTLTYVGVAMIVAGLWAINPSLGFAALGAFIAYYSFGVVNVRVSQAINEAKIAAFREAEEEEERRAAHERAIEAREERRTALHRRNEGTGSVDPLRGDDGRVR